MDYKLFVGENWEERTRVYLEAIDERIADALETSAATVARERRRFSEDGLEVALMPRKPGFPRRGALVRLPSTRSWLLHRHR